MCRITNYEKYCATWSFQKTSVKIIPGSDSLICARAHTHTLKSHYHKNGCMGSSTNHEKYRAIWSFQNTGVKIMPNSDPFIYTHAPTRKFHHQVLQVNWLDRGEMIFSHLEYFLSYLFYWCTLRTLWFQGEHHCGSVRGENDAFRNAYCSWHILLLLWGNYWLEICNVSLWHTQCLTPKNNPLKYGFGCKCFCFHCFLL